MNDEDDGGDRRHDPGQGARVPAAAAAGEARIFPVKSGDRSHLDWHRMQGFFVCLCSTCVLNLCVQIHWKPILAEMIPCRIQAKVDLNHHLAASSPLRN